MIFLLLATCFGCASGQTTLEAVKLIEFAAGGNDGTAGRLADPGVALLARVVAPLFVVALIGNGRSGKSFLGQILAQTLSSFE
eukprot:SAG11_NODE_3283_length_2553_cov_1.110839_2_plen_83_part_00